MADRVASDAESSRRDRTKSAATRKRSEAAKEQNKRPGFFAGIWLFFKQVIDEMKKVTYPTRSLRQSAVVLTLSECLLTLLRKKMSALSELNRQAKELTVVNMEHRYATEQWVFILE